MTLETTTSKAVYTGNGATTEFPFSFKVWDEDQILVSVTDAQGYVQETGEYSVTLSAGGGTVFYLHDGAPLPSGWKLAITRDMPFTQEDDYITGTRFDPEVIETALDKATAERQQLREQLQRAVILPPTSDETPEDMAQELLRARDEAVQSAAAAQDSESAAASSASQSAASAQAAAASAEAADQSRAAAAASTADASQSATAARQSAEAAAGSEDRAARSAASILGLQVEVATLDPGLPAGGDYDPETGILHLGIPKGDSGASAIATPTSLGSVMPQTGHEDGLELETDGKLRVRKASASQRGGVLASTTAAANTVPQAGADGKLDPSWVYAGLPLGYIFAWPFPTAPDGCIILNGSMYSRTLYADFFAYIKSKGWTKTETEWQSIAQANNGFCPWYSEGDGSTNFRTPKFAPYQKLTLASGDAGKYYETGLPNITGTFGSSVGSPADFTGAFLSNGKSYNVAESSVSLGSYLGKLDASLANSIYGNSTTVRPESHDWLVCAVAFGVATNVGSVDVADVMSAVGQVQATAIEIDSSGYSSGQHWVRYKDGRQIIYSDWKEDIRGTTTFIKPFTTNPCLIGFDNEDVPANTERRRKFSAITGTYFTTTDWAYGATTKSGCWIAMGIWK